MMSRISQLPNFSTPKFFPTSGTNFAPSIGGRNGLSFFFFFTFFIFPKSPRSIISNGSVLESFGALYRKFWVVEVDWFIGVPASEYTSFYGFCTIYPISVAFPDSPDSVSFKLRCHQKDHDTYSLSLSTFLVQFLILD